MRAPRCRLCEREHWPRVVCTLITAPAIKKKAKANRKIKRKSSQ